MDFPEVFSLTITNRCNLKCKMCGQWGITGYMNKKTSITNELSVNIWKRVINEYISHGKKVILVRGGEPFFYPDIIELLTYIKQKGAFVAIDTNGTLLEKFAVDILKIGVDHITVSVDGPEKIHNNVRGLKDAYQKIKKGQHKIVELEKSMNKKPMSRSLCFTISPDSYKGLPEMPDTARDLKISVLSINPYFYFNKETGRRYEKIMEENLACKAYSWKGFHREESGVDVEEFLDLLKKFKENLKELSLYPYMDYNDEQYRIWFTDCTTDLGDYKCQNPWKLIDIQPNGDVNFCVDFPDYIIGNIKDNTIEEIWHNDRAEKFRNYYKDSLLPLCVRCGAKYMSLSRE